LPRFRSADSFVAVQLTIDIPDDLAKRLEPERDRLVEIIRRGLREPAPRAESVVEEVSQFLARRPKTVEVLAFRASEKSQERLRALLEKSRNHLLTEEEEAELDTLETLDDLVALVKLQARGQSGSSA
jgi:hypothetical protein